MKKKALRQFKKRMVKWLETETSKVEEHSSSNIAFKSTSDATDETCGATKSVLEAIATGVAAVEDCSDGKPYESFMTEAIAESEAAVQDGNHPFGAVLVVDGAVVLRGRNAVVTESDATRHAELVSSFRSTFSSGTKACPL